MRQSRRRRPAAVRMVALALAAAMACLGAATTARAAVWTPPPPTYQLNDTAGGRTLSVLPPGEHGLYNAADIAQYEASGTRPAGADDQLGQYTSLLYAPSGLTDAQLPTYYNDESFGIQSGQVTRTETPSPSVGVVIYRDAHDVPHIYGRDRPSLAFGAGYAAAEDRLFEMDVLRHYGAGTLSAFLGPSCADEQMDHDALLLGGYTQAQKDAQIANLGSEYGALGAELSSMATQYINGINAYIAATQTNAALLPADYAAVGGTPQTWQVSDVIDIATLVGGIFGRGGGAETRNATLVRYLQRQFGVSTAQQVFADFKEQNDPDAPTTVSTSFPYEQPASIDPTQTALVDSASLSGGPTDTTSNCSATAPNLPALGILAAINNLPTEMSNALLVDAAHSADGHPIAVMGPQVGYYTPQILMEEDLHAPDFDAEGTAFPGTNFIVELGRGQNFAWSATSANTDNVDQVAELICDPNGGTPAANGTSYMYKGVCTPMTSQTFTETAVTKPAGTGAPVQLSHTIHYTVHGVVQGWTTVNGAPVAIVNERSTYGHEVDSGVGFLSLDRPSLTHDAASFEQSAAEIQYTFNWFYLDARDIAYYQSGLDPIRAPGADPNLPTWGTGAADWQGFLDVAGHPHAIGSPTGYILSWNNKPAPDFSAADDNYTYGPVQRVESLQRALNAQLAAAHGSITRADLVSAMEHAASVDLLGTTVLPELLTAVPASSQPAGVQAMLAALRSWLGDGALRRKASAGDAQYADAAGVAIMDELYPHIVQALFDNLFAAGGTSTQLGLPSAYNVLPEAFSQEASQTGGNGSAYYGGIQSQVDKVLRQLNGEPVAQPFSSTTTSLLCGGAGLAGCSAALSTALANTYASLTSINGSTAPATWASNSETASTGRTIPQIDAIAFTAVGVAGQPNIDWQNRPTFQQVVEFVGSAPNALPEAPAAPWLLITLPALALVEWRRRHTRRRAA
ncbi:MAG: penicillin acylase family protein [Candidatus Dormibacteria bacterium]